MIEKRLVKNQTKLGSLVSKVYLYSGVAIMISALCYMIANLQKADSIVHVWFLFMIGGVGLGFTGLILKLYYKNATGEK
jgi:surface polysaccharide O-acyltransferase-like enzyme